MCLISMLTWLLTVRHTWPTYGCLEETPLISLTVTYLMGKGQRTATELLDLFVHYLVIVLRGAFVDP